MNSKSKKSYKFNDENLIILKDIFHFIIPVDNNKLPGADYLLEKDIDFLQEDITLFINISNQISKESLKLYAKNFLKLNKEERKNLLIEFSKKNKKEFINLALRVVTYYYTDSYILGKIGIKSIPPFPDGNYVIEGDLIMFEDVYLRGSIYRKV